jgi:LacI family gluconate utilization system Gnt-I transcriptional repressor
VTHYDPGEEEQLLRSQLMHRPAGMLVTGFDRSEATRAADRRQRRALRAPDGNLGAPGVYSVGLSQADAGAAMTRHLLERGRRRIAFAAAQLDPRTMQRLEGWRRTLRRRGCIRPVLEWLNPAPSSLALGGALFEQILGQSPPVDAIFFCNDDLAQGALLAALRLGVRCPSGWPWRASTT